VIPMYKIGLNNDFAMRASIPALAILAVMLGTACSDALAHGLWTSWMVLAAASLAIGSASGGMEIRRALIRSPLAVSECNLVQVSRSDHPTVDLVEYLARIDRIPRWIAPGSVTAAPTEFTNVCPRTGPDLYGTP
jgi:hypothetical protein